MFQFRSLLLLPLKNVSVDCKSIVQTQVAGLLLHREGLTGFNAMILEDNPDTRKQAADVIRNGGVIAFRTDTFYGLGADPFNPVGVVRIRELKGREETKPILLLISDADQVGRFLAETSKTFHAVAEQHWPGPITLVGVAHAELSKELTGGSGTIGLRLPDDEGVRAFVRACNGALTATSANRSGSPPACTAKEVESYFPEGIALIIDRGQVTTTQPSTVLDLSNSEPRLVREGAITREELRTLLSNVEGPRSKV